MVTNRVLDATTVRRAPSAMIGASVAPMKVVVDGANATIAARAATSVAAAADAAWAPGAVAVVRAASVSGR